MTTGYNPIEALNRDDKDEASAEAKKSLERKLEEEDLRWMMGHAQGRRIMWRWFEAAGVFHLAFQPNAMQMAFMEGRRDMGLKSLGEITSLCPDRFVQMLKEHEKDDNRNSGDRPKHK